MDFPGTFADYDGESAAEFLDRLRFPEGRGTWPSRCSRAASSPHPSDFSAGELVAMFHAYFLGSSEGLLFDVPRDDYDTVLWAPLRRYLDELGVDVRRGAPVERLLAGEELRVESAPGMTCQPMRSCWRPIRRRCATLLLDRGVGLGDKPGGSGWPPSAIAPPFAVWRVWLDRPVAQDRPPFLGTSRLRAAGQHLGAGTVRGRARRWSAPHGGSVVELHAYALVGEPDEREMRARLRAELDRVYPELSGAGWSRRSGWSVTTARWPAPAPWAHRLTVGTPDPRIMLAGDGVRCDYPVALMERAATTGFLAANSLLADRGLVGHDLWTVPMSSRHRVSRPLHRLLTR